MIQLTRFDGHGLDARENAILKKLATQWQSHQPQNDLRGLYYLGKRSLRMAGKLGFAMPPALEKLEIPLGWPAKAVSALEHRLDIRGFLIPEDPTRDAGIDQIVRDNDLLVESSMAHTAGLIHGAAFITVSEGDQQSGEPPAVIAARSAREATALWSKRSRRVTAGLTINPPSLGTPAQVTLWLPDQVITITKTRTGYTLQRHPHRLGRVPMEMLAYRPYLENPHGQPRITDIVMGLTDAAVRTVLRMEGTAEFFSFPQRYALGVNKNDFEDTFKTYLNRLLALGRDEDGNLPEFGQFTSASPEPHIAQLRALAAQFAGETAIPLNQLGIVQDNPASADAIRAAEAELIKTAERAQRGYAPAWARSVAMAHQIYDASPEADPRLDSLMTQWYDAATETKAATAQSVMTLVQTGVLPTRSRITWEQLGYDEATIRRLESDAARDQAARTLATLSQAAGTNPEIQQQADLLVGVTDPGTEEVKVSSGDAAQIKAMADALGSLIRAGVDPVSAANHVGLTGIEFTGATPVSLRQPESKADHLEER